MKRLKRKWRKGYYKTRLPSTADGYEIDDGPQWSVPAAQIVPVYLNKYEQDALANRACVYCKHYENEDGMFHRCNLHGCPTAKAGLCIHHDKVHFIPKEEYADYYTEVLTIQEIGRTHITPETKEFMLRGLSEKDRMSVKTQIHSAELRGVYSYTISYSNGFYNITNGVITMSGRGPGTEETQMVVQVEEIPVRRPRKYDIH